MNFCPNWIFVPTEFLYQVIFCTELIFVPSEFLSQLNFCPNWIFDLFLDNGVMQMERMVIGAAGDRASFNGKYELLTG